MPKAIFVIAAMLYFSNVSAQQSFREYVDSAIGVDHFSEKDWAIVLKTWGGGGRVPIYDSLGNEIFFEPEPFTTIVVYNIKNVFYLQRFKESCYDGDTCFHASTRLPLSNGTGINYTVDSIKQAEKEWIYKYIYKDEEGGYIYQEDSNHSTDYVITFITQQLNRWSSLTSICFKESIMQDESWPKNLNYSLNINTFTYRAFCVIERFIVENRKLIPTD
jgi:hypothetical protein